VQIEEAHAQATHMAARTDDAGVFRAVGLRVLTQVEQNAGLMRLLLCSAFKVDAFAALEGHALAHILLSRRCTDSTRSSVATSRHGLLMGSFDRSIL